MFHFTNTKSKHQVDTSNKYFGYVPNVFLFCRKKFCPIFISFPEPVTVLRLVKWGVGRNWEKGICK
jgi:hypothetical protein